MPSRKSYNRFFIILQEDQKGYGMDTNRTPSGYAKLEMRNDRAKTSFYIQDIKKQNGPYYMVLIAQGNGGTRELINLGQINIDEGGKADVSNEHDTNNVAGTNIGMDKIQGAGICRINGSKVNPVMVGFICGEELKNWATYPIARTGGKASKYAINMSKPSEESIEKEVKKETRTLEEKKKEPVEINELKKEVEIEKEIEKEIEEESRGNEVHKEDEPMKEEQVSSIEGETQDFDEYEEQIERLKEYRKKHNSKQCDDDDHKHHEHHKCHDKDEDHHHECHDKDEDHHHECHDKDEDHHHKHHHKDGDYHHNDEHPIGAMGEFFKNVVSGLEKIGHKESIKNCMWYKASVENLDAMYCIHDYNKYSVIFYPMICYYPYIAKAKHFMIGYKCDDEGVLKYIIYAIPGTKALIDQPYDGKTGFVTFMSDTENSERGHWLMYYDVRKNSVVVPVKKRK